MIDKNFYKNKGPFPLSYLISQLDLDCIGNKEFLISDIAPLDSAGPNEITFFHDKRYENQFKKTRAGAIIIDKKFFTKSDLNKNYILSDSPYFTMAIVASIFYPGFDYPNFFHNEDERIKNIDSTNNISSNSFIHKDSIIGKNCVIGSFVKIGPGVKIGDNCVIGDNVNIYFSLISDNVKIYNGAKIGGEGFGFVPGKNAIKKVPQLGRVIIKKNSEIGCNATIDRGSIGDTIIETAGMLPYSDFTEQTSGEVEGRILRPDVVINLPNQGSLAVDAKAPEFAEAYEKMIATESIEEQQLLLADHIKSMRAHVKTLSLKEYWNQFDRSPEFVVMFVPLESMLSDALKADPTLVDDAMRSRVLIASPMNLLALLLAAHRGWQDFRVQEDAKKIGDLTKELYKRFSTLFDYVRKTGKGIQQSTTNYNNLVGALESRVLPTLRKLDDLNVVDGEIASIEPLETSIRELSVPEDTPEIENLES